PGMAALPQGGELKAPIDSLRGPSAGNCTVGGPFSNGSLFALPFIAAQKNGRRGDARPLPRVRAVGRGPAADPPRLPCPSAGNCIAVGDYTAKSSNFSELTYVVSEKNGRWGRAKTLPGAKGLSRHGELGPQALSCGARGHCAVGGIYFVANG